jgi:hypothetical protein
MINLEQLILITLKTNSYKLHLIILQLELIHQIIQERIRK